jgi:hypothetical protein
MRCIICGKETKGGAIGRAGIRWSCICQTCKDREDTALAKSLEAVKNFANFVSNSFQEVKK